MYNRGMKRVGSWDQQVRQKITCSIDVYENVFRSKLNENIALKYDQTLTHSSCIFTVYHFWRVHFTILRSACTVTPCKLKRNYVEMFKKTLSSMFWPKNMCDSRNISLARQGLYVANQFILCYFFLNIAKKT